MITKTQKIFHLFTHFLGVNFSAFSLKTYVGFFIAINAFNIYLSFYIPIKQNWFNKLSIYIIMNSYQMHFPFFIQNFIIFRAYLLKEKQRKILVQLIPKFPQKVGKCERNYLLRILFILTVRILKLACSSNIGGYIWMLQTFICELIYSGNDLMFVYYVELMVEFLDYINQKILTMRTYEDLKGIRRDIIHIFKMKRKIQKRYSVDLFVTITYNFVLNITSFYWILMRAIFHHLEKLNEIVTFSYLLVPVFVMWIICYQCESFIKKVLNFLDFLFLK